MPIIHIRKHENNFVQIDKRPLENENLSWKAKGLWTYLISKPPNWKVLVADLVKRSTDQEYAVRAALNELIKNGYAERKARRGTDGKIKEWDFYIYEQPHRGFQDVGNQDVDNQDVGNLGLNKNDCSKNDLNENDNKSATSSDFPFDIPERTERESEEQDAYPVASWAGPRLERFIREVCGLNVTAGVDRLGDVKKALVSHGEAETEAALKMAFDAWCDTESKESRRKYSPYNPGWINWGVEYLLTGEKRWIKSNGVSVSISQPEPVELPAVVSMDRLGVG